MARKNSRQMEQKPLTPSFLHIFSIVRDGTLFGVYGDTLIVSPLQTFTKCISCLVNKKVPAFRELPVQS